MMVLTKKNEAFDVKLTHLKSNSRFHARDHQTGPISRFNDGAALLKEQSTEPHQEQVHVI